MRFLSPILASAVLLGATAVASAAQHHRGHVHGPYRTLYGPYGSFAGPYYGGAYGSFARPYYGGAYGSFAGPYYGGAYGSFAGPYGFRNLDSCRVNYRERPDILFQDIGYQEDLGNNC